MTTTIYSRLSQYNVHVINVIMIHWKGTMTGFTPASGLVFTDHDVMTPCDIHVHVYTI